MDMESFYQYHFSFVKVSLVCGFVVAPVIFFFSPLNLSTCNATQFFLFFELGLEKFGCQHYFKLGLIKLEIEAVNFAKSNHQTSQIVFWKGMLQMFRALEREWGKALCAIFSLNNSIRCLNAFSKSVWVMRLNLECLNTEFRKIFVLVFSFKQRLLMTIL